MRSLRKKIILFAAMLIVPIVAGGAQSQCQEQCEQEALGNCHTLCPWMSCDHVTTGETQCCECSIPGIVEGDCIP